MNVLIIPSHVGKDAIGGTELAFIGLAKELNRRGVQSRIIIPDTECRDSALERLHSLGLSVTTDATVLSLANPLSWRALIHVREVVRGYRPDAVSLHYGDNTVPLKGVLGVRLAGITRCIVTVHHHKPLADRRRRRSTRLAARLAHAIVVGTPAMARLLQAQGVPGHKIQLIPYGLSIDEEPPSKLAARRALGVAPEAFVIGCLTRLVAHKGVGDLLEAAARIRGDGHRTVVVIGGEGPCRPEWEQLATERLGDRAIFLGQIENPSQLYAAADVFCLPSQEEGFGMVFLEAALHGVPSVATAVGGVPYIVRHEHTGLLVHPGQVASITHALERLYNDPQLVCHLGDNAKALARSTFSPESMGASYMKVLFAE